jgi:hypothetical protein
MCKRYHLYKCADSTRTYVTWLTAGSRKEAIDTVRWFGKLHRQSPFFHLSEGEYFELLEQPTEELAVLPEEEPAGC